MKNISFYYVAIVFMGIFMIKTQAKKVEMQKERCVCCGKVTPYYFETDIKDRLYYVEGCGQLCKKCFLLTQIESLKEEG